MSTAKKLWRRAIVSAALAVPAFLAFGPLADAALSKNHSETVLHW